MKRENKGFTLVELLIVVAIIAVLAAIAIPIMNARLESSREAADISNLRSAYALAMAEAMSGQSVVGGYYVYNGVSGILEKQSSGFQPEQSSDYRILQGTSTKGGNGKRLPGGLEYKEEQDYTGGWISVTFNDDSLDFAVHGPKLTAGGVSVRINYDGTSTSPTP